MSLFTELGRLADGRGDIRAELSLREIGQGALEEIGRLQQLVLEYQGRAIALHAAATHLIDRKHWKPADCPECHAIREVLEGAKSEVTL